MSFEQILVLNDARSYLYSLAHTVYTAPLEEQQVQATLSELSFQAFDVFKNTGNADYDEALSVLEQVVSQGIDHKALERDYTVLFIGPEKVKAFLWESAYKSPTHLLFQQSTLEVRQMFSDEGYVFAKYPKEADDHLAAEMDFMKNLSERLGAAAESNNAEEALRLMELQREFLEKHLLTWFDLFNKDVCDAQEEADLQAYYPLFTKLIASFLHLDVHMLQEMSELYKNSTGLSRESQELSDTLT